MSIRLRSEFRRAHISPAPPPSPKEFSCSCSLVALCRTASSTDGAPRSRGPKGSERGPKEVRRGPKEVRRGPEGQREDPHSSSLLTAQSKAIGFFAIGVAVQTGGRLTDILPSAARSPHVGIMARPSPHVGIMDHPFHHRSRFSS